MDPDDIAEGVQWFHDHDKLEYLMEFLARYVRKVHSDRYLKKVLSQTPGLSFLDIIGPSDISYINCIIKNSQEIWLEAISTERSNDEGGQGMKKSAKALFTSGEGKKRVFGECLWNNDGQHYYTYGRDKWAEAYDKKRLSIAFYAMHGRSGYLRRHIGWCLGTGHRSQFKVCWLQGTAVVKWAMHRVEMMKRKR